MEGHPLPCTLSSNHHLWQHQPSLALFSTPIFDVKVCMYEHDILGVFLGQAGPGKIGTELLMEPQHGHVWVERQQGTKGSGGGNGDGSFWMCDKVGGFGCLARAPQSRAVLAGVFVVSVRHKHFPTFYLTVRTPSPCVSRHPAVSDNGNLPVFVFVLDSCGQTGREGLHASYEAQSSGLA